MVNQDREAMGSRQNPRRRYLFPNLGALSSNFVSEGIVGLTGHAVQHRQVINLYQPQQDKRFNAAIDDPYAATTGLTGNPHAELLAKVAGITPPSSTSATSSSPGIDSLLLIPVEADILANDAPQSVTAGTPVSFGQRTRREVIAVIQCVLRPAAAVQPTQQLQQQIQQALLSVRSGSLPEASSTTPGPVTSATPFTFGSVVSGSRPRVFTTAVCRLLCRISDTIGNIIRNTRRLDLTDASLAAARRARQRFVSLIEVSNAMNTETKVEPVVARIAREVPELLDADRCTLFFVDHEKQQLIVRKDSSNGRPKSLLSWVFGQSNAPELPFNEGTTEIYFPMNKGIAGYVARTGETLNIPDAHADPRFNAEMDKTTGYKTRNMLCVPMLDKNRVVQGVVQVINKNPRYPCFDQEDEEVLGSFAAQASLSVTNSALLESTERALRQSEGLLQITRALSTEMRDIEQLMRIVVRTVQELLSSERCTVFIVDRENKELYTNEGMSYGMGPALPINHERTTMIRFPMDRGIAGSVATTLQTVNIKDAYEDSRFNRAMDKQTGFRTRSILCMAILPQSRQESIGVIQCMNKIDPRRKTPSIFTQADEELLAAFCSQAAVAIENSRLFAHTEKILNQNLMEFRNAKLKFSITKKLAISSQLSQLIDQVKLLADQLLKADECVLYFVDHSTNEFYFAKDDTDDGRGARRFPLGQGIAGRVALTGEIINIVADAYKDPQFDPAIDQRKNRVTHSILCAPIKSDNTIVGVISVRDEKNRGGFELPEIKLLKIICAHAEIAISNRRRLKSFFQSHEVKTDVDRSATEYLMHERGMKIASSDVDNYLSYRMDDIKLLNSIGSGSYGEVYKAIVNDDIVAVKRLHARSLRAEQVESFCSEVSLMCQLKHPNIVGFVGAVTEPSALCIITEFCQNGSLADLLLQPTIPMSFEWKLRAALDAARGMQYLHSSNPVILHRDLKSDNLLVDANWRVKVADFGLTRFLSKKAMTQVGTPMWMAPEIITGEQYTENADVYAFGIILWELLTRSEPYEDMEQYAIIMQVVEGRRPKLTPETEASPIVPLMKDCWAAKPADRPTFDVIVERLCALETRLAEQGQPLDQYGLTRADRERLGLDVGVQYEPFRSSKAHPPLAPVTLKKFATENANTSSTTGSAANPPSATTASPSK